MKISFDGQLTKISLIVTFREKSLQIDDIIIITGSSHTVISPDILEEIGIIYEMGDDIYEAYGIGILYLSLHCPNLTLLILK